MHAAKEKTNLGEENLEMVPYLFYLALRGVDAYYEENHYRYPGQGIPCCEEEANQLKISLETKDMQIE